MNGNRSWSPSRSESWAGGRPRTVLGRLVARRDPVRPSGLLPPSQWLPGTSWGGGFPGRGLAVDCSGGSSPAAVPLAAARSHLPVAAPAGHAHMFEYITRAWSR